MTIRIRIQHGLGCVVTSPWSTALPSRGGVLRALINPANEALIGPARPYFPRGGPVPPKPPPSLSASSVGWGGMDAGPDMLYPTQTVDGLVHQYGGRALQAELAAHPVIEERADGDHVRCRVGDARPSSSPSSLPFDVIAHTPTPFWPASSAADHGDVRAHRMALACCFSSALALAVETARRTQQERLWLATPLLGAGARGAPAAVAADVLVHALLRALALPPPPPPGRSDNERHDLNLEKQGPASIVSVVGLSEVVVRVVVPPGGEDEAALRSAGARSEVAWDDAP